LLDIDLLYAARVSRLLGGGEWLTVAMALCPAAFAPLLNPAAGRRIAACPGPACRPTPLA